MSNICAGIGRGQMTIIEKHLAHHRHACSVYEKLFMDVDGIDVHVNPTKDYDSNYWLNTITINPNKIKTDYEQIRLHLSSKGIESRPLWKPMHTQPVFKDAPSYTNGVSEALFKKGLCLPSGPWVSDEDIMEIVSSIKEIIK